MSTQHLFRLPSLADQWVSAASLDAHAWANALAQAAGLRWVGLIELPVPEAGAPASGGRPLAGFLQDAQAHAAPMVVHAGWPEQGAAPCWPHAWVPAPPALRQGLLEGASSGVLVWRLIAHEASLPALAAVVQVPPLLGPATSAEASGGHPPPLQAWLAKIDDSWAPLLPLLTNAYRLEQDGVARARSQLQLMQRQDWLEQALCFAREVIWELDVPSMTLRYSRYVAGLQPRNGQDLPLSHDEFVVSMHPDDRETAMRCLQDYIEGRSPECYLEYRQRHQDGHWIWSRSRGRALLRDLQGRPVRILGTAVGISLQKNLEVSLRESEQRLLASEAQLQARERELRAALALAQEAARSRTQFLATMSHEIRTPLNSIVGASRLALLETDPQAVAEHLTLIHEASGLLMSLVNSVLDHSRLQAGAVTLEQRPVSLLRLLQDVARQFTSAARARGLELSAFVSPDVPAAVQADALRLTQVVNNLVANAVRFTHAGRVELRAEAVSTTGVAVGHGRLRISVADTGIGMTAEQCERLFQPYGQADDTIARRYGGTGLGLSISHRLVELMGGQLTVRSQPGVGSVFFFECDWPLADATALGEPPSDASSLARRAHADQACTRLQQAAQRVRGLRVLVVDDNPMNIHVVRKFLEMAQVQVQTTASAAQALKVLEQATFDAVLMDLYMPEMSGADATRLLRQNPRHLRLPVLAVSASVTPEERELCRDAGMDAFISKPLDPEHLLATLAQLCATPPATISSPTSTSAPTSAPTSESES